MGAYEISMSWAYRLAIVDNHKPSNHYAKFDFSVIPPVYQAGDWINIDGELYKVHEFGAYIETNLRGMYLNRLTHKLFVTKSPL